jgi:hypothetical protein
MPSDRARFDEIHLMTIVNETQRVGIRNFVEGHIIFTRAILEERITNLTIEQC